GDQPEFPLEDHGRFVEQHIEGDGVPHAHMLGGGQHGFARWAPSHFVTPARDDAQAPEGGVTPYEGRAAHHTRRQEPERRVKKAPYCRGEREPQKEDRGADDDEDHFLSSFSLASSGLIARFIAKLARYFAYSLLSSFKVCGLRHQCTKSMSWGSTG